jgi:hypothetical protein
MADDYSSLPLSVGIWIFKPEWMPITMDSTESYRYMIYYIYIMFLQFIYKHEKA